MNNFTEIPMIFDAPNVSFILLCSSLVMLMTPGLAFFYGGLVSRKSIVTIMLQCFISMSWTAVLWFAIGYSLSFAPSSNGIIGDPFYYAFLNNISPETLYAGNQGGVPLLVHFVYQMMFAIITPALITGAFAHRVNFSAYMIFITLWTLLVYCPFVHMIWSPDGVFARWGVADFAGGIVVHATAGLAALASAIYVGKRMVNTRQDHNIPFVALGAGLLWFGWYGFNAGSEFQINTITVSAFVATDISAAFAAVVWLILDRAHSGTIKLSAFLTGAVAGLATITPAAGYVSIGSAALIGAIGSLVCYYSVLLVRRHIDDALDVFAVHGMGGIAGSILVGVFASLTWSQSGSVKPIDSGVMQVMKQTCAVLAAAGWSFVATLIILKLADTITPVKINKDIVGDDLDQQLLGESAYE